MQQSLGQQQRPLHQQQSPNTQQQQLAPTGRGRGMPVIIPTTNTQQQNRHTNLRPTGPNSPTSSPRNVFSNDSNIPSDKIEEELALLEADYVCCCCAVVGECCC